MHIDEPSNLLFPVSFPAIKPPKTELLIHLIHRRNLLIPFLRSRPIIRPVQHNIPGIPLIRPSARPLRTTPASRVPCIETASTAAAFAHAAG